MDQKLRLLLVAANENERFDEEIEDRRRAFSVEFDKRGVFVTIGRFDTYLCWEPEGACFWRVEHGALDTQFWRMHLMVGSVPA
jgi:hypothetical protein